MEVLVGPGTVMRSGGVAAWAGPTASPALLGFLHQSLRNVGPSGRGGRLLADHVAGILAQRDPEPGAAFGAVGRDDGGWVAILHGPVQLWDGETWLAPAPSEGWKLSAVTPRPALSLGPAGSALPQLHPDSPYDLAGGTVPGGGFLLVPAGADLALAGAFAAGSSAPGPGEGRPRAHGAPPPSAAGSYDPLVASAPRAAPPPAGDRSPPSSGRLLDLRSAPSVTRDPLPGVDATPGPPAGPAPLVPGRRCPNGHFNHPAAPRCARCAERIASPTASSGARPPIGLLLADDGNVYRVDGDLVLGADPGADPAVAGGGATPLRLASRDSDLAPAHLEIRVSGWSVTVADRGAAAGTHLVRPGRTDWERLAPLRPEPLEPGSHLSLGRRVLTFVSPWPLGGPTSPAIGS